MRSSIRTYPLLGTHVRSPRMSAFAVHQPQNADQASIMMRRFSSAACRRYALSTALPIKCPSALDVLAGKLGFVAREQTQQAPREEPSGPRACANSHYASVR